MHPGFLQNLKGQQEHQHLQRCGKRHRFLTFNHGAEQLQRNHFLVEGCHSNKQPRQEQAQKQADSAFEQSCVEKAAENTTVDMPKALVEAELDNQMERFGYQLQMSGYSMEAYAKMMGGDMNTMRNAFRPAAEKQAKANVTLAKIVEVEGITVTDEDMEAEFEAMAKQYELEVAKIKEMVPAEEVKTSLQTRKAVKVIVDSAVAVAPKAQETASEE